MAVKLLPLLWKSDQKHSEYLLCRISILLNSIFQSDLFEKAPNQVISVFFWMSSFELQVRQQKTKFSKWSEKLCRLNPISFMSVPWYWQSDWLVIIISWQDSVTSINRNIYGKFLNLTWVCKCVFCRSVCCCNARLWVVLLLLFVIA